MSRKKKRRAVALTSRESAAPFGNGSALAPNDLRLDFGERWAYAPAPEQSDYIQIKPRYQLFINGKFRAPHSRRHFDSVNPATEGKLAEIAVEGIVAGIYFNQGHVCCAGSRLLVQEGVFAAVIRKLRDRISTLRIGDPLDKNTDIGAINSRMQLDKICELVESGVQQGAELHQPGQTFGIAGKGLLVSAEFLHRRDRFAPHCAGRDLRAARPERHDLPHAEEAIKRANNTPYGLSAGVWTDKGSKIFKIVSKLRAGVFWANTYNKFDPASPFGGYRESGFGREGGLHGLARYLALS